MLLAESAGGVGVRSNTSPCERIRLDTTETALVPETAASIGYPPQTGFNGMLQSEVRGHRYNDRPTIFSS
jgi:hypothetical protein